MGSLHSPLWLFPKCCPQSCPLVRTKPPALISCKMSTFPGGVPSPLQVHRHTWGTRGGSEVTPAALTLGGHTAACPLPLPSQVPHLYTDTGPAFVVKASAPVSSARVGPRLRLQDEGGLRVRSWLPIPVQAPAGPVTWDKFLGLSFPICTMDNGQAP